MAQKFKHLHFIVDIVKNNPGISLRDLVFKLDEYNSPSSRQMLEKDIYALQTEYEVPLVYDQELKGYVIDEESDSELRTFQNFAKQQAMNGMLADMLHDGAKVWDVVDVDSQMPIMQIATEACRYLIQQIKNQNPITNVVHECELVIRASTAPPGKQGR